MFLSEPNKIRQQILIMIYSYSDARVVISDRNGNELISTESVRSVFLPLISQLLYKFNHSLIYRANRSKALVCILIAKVCLSVVMSEY